MIREANQMSSWHVVDIMKLQSRSQHPHGLTDLDYDSIFTQDKHIIFNFHGYPRLIHSLIYQRKNQNIHVKGYNEEGTFTTPFDLRVQNNTDRFNLVFDVIDRLPHLRTGGDYLKQQLKYKLIEHKRYISEHGIDLPEIRDWHWKIFETRQYIGRSMCAWPISAIS